MLLSSHHSNPHSPVCAPQSIFWNSGDNCLLNVLFIDYLFELACFHHLAGRTLNHLVAQIIGLKFLYLWLHYCNNSQLLAKHNIGYPPSHKFAQFLTSFCPSRCQPSFSTVHCPENPCHSSLVLTVRIFSAG